MPVLQLKYAEAHGDAGADGDEAGIGADGEGVVAHLLNGYFLQQRQLERGVRRYGEDIEKCVATRDDGGGVGRPSHGHNDGAHGVLVRRARADGVGAAADDAELARTVERRGDVGAIGGKSDAICMVECDFDCSVIALAQSFGRVCDQLPKADGAILKARLTPLAVNKSGRGRRGISHRWLLRGCSRRS